MDGSITFGGLEEVEDCGVVGVASKLPFTNCPSGGTSSELEAGEAGDCLPAPRRRLAILP